MKELFKKLNCCVIIPTYNNGGTLLRVIESVLQYTDDLIVVNDGATDNTSAILASLEGKIKLVNHPTNSGKGMALRNGFAYALEQGYDHAITIDSDAQHFADDLPLFLEELEDNPGTLVIGARNMTQANVPGKSSFGNRFSNFWFWVETGNKLTDTQSGYRLYPIRKMSDIRYRTSLFEFEIEAIVKAAWRDIPVKNIPIQVHYEPGKQRITHFRPMRDFTRISILNTYLVTLALLYYIPRRFLTTLTRKKIHDFIRKSFFKPGEPMHIKALSIAFGVFMGIFPVWGFQLLIGIPLAHLFRLNKALFITAAHISIPPTIPFIIWGSYALGATMVSDPQNNILFTDGITLEAVQDNFFQYLVGAIALSVLSALIVGAISYAYLFLTRSKQPVVRAVEVK